MIFHYQLNSKFTHKILIQDILEENKDRAIDYPNLCMTSYDSHYQDVKEATKGRINSSTIRLMQIAEKITERLQGGRQFMGWEVTEEGQIEQKKKAKRTRKKKEGWTEDDMMFIEDVDDEKDKREREHIKKDFFMVSGGLEFLKAGLKEWIFGGEEEPLKKKKKSKSYIFLNKITYLLKIYILYET